MSLHFVDRAAIEIYTRLVTPEQPVDHANFKADFAYVAALILWKTRQGHLVRLRAATNPEEVTLWTAMERGVVTP